MNMINIFTRNDQNVYPSSLYILSPLSHKSLLYLPLCPSSLYVTLVSTVTQVSTVYCHSISTVSTVIPDSTASTVTPVSIVSTVTQVSTVSTITLINPVSTVPTVALFLYCLLSLLSLLSLRSLLSLQFQLSLLSL